MSLKDLGSMAFWLERPNLDWTTDEQGYDFGSISGPEGVFARAVKHPNRTVELTFVGPLWTTLRFVRPLPKCKGRGLFVVLNWQSPSATLYLNTELVESRTVESPRVEKKVGDALPETRRVKSDKVEIKVDNTFAKTFGSPFNIRSKHAINAVAHHDQIHIVPFDEVCVNLYAKRVENIRRPFHLLVQTWLQSRVNRVDAAFKIYSDLTAGCESLPPLDMLRALVDRFGVDLDVGERTGRFILDESIPLSGGRAVPAIHGQKPKNHELTLQFLAKQEPGPPPVMRVALCYCLDRDAYIAWMEKH